MKRTIFIITFVVILVVAIAAIFFYEYVYKNSYEYQVKQGVYEPILTKNVDIDEDKLWDDVQNWRVSNNLTKFTTDDRLCDIADLRATELSAKGTIDNHVGFVEKYKNNEYVLSENLSQTTNTNAEESILNGWLSSTSHRNALSGDWIYSCIKTEGNIAVQIFSSFDNINHNAL